MKDHTDPKMTHSFPVCANEWGVSIIQDYKTKEENIWGWKKVSIFGHFKFEMLIFIFSRYLCF